MTKETRTSMAEKLEPDAGSSRRNRRGSVSGASSVTAEREKIDPGEQRMMEEVVERENMRAAYRQVRRNGGAPGIDGMNVEDLGRYLTGEWQGIKGALLGDRYEPQPVKRVEIAKPGGGMRQLGIPTVVDRMIQQALHQVMSREFEPGFSESSYGFRPGRSAHDAVLKAQEYVASGKRWVVDMDLEKFFDRVNHDVLMARVARKVKDKRVLRLVRRYLEAGVMDAGLVSPRTEGTPQGGPLSPLMSNVLLDELDKELEKRGHTFCRYADDCNVYVRSKRAGERVMRTLEEFLSKRLRLRVNRAKSAVDRPWKRKFLGYSMTAEGTPRLKVAPESERRLREKLKAEFRRARGRNLDRQMQELRPLLIGWSNYFRHAQVKATFERLDTWIRRRFRCVQWRQWKKPRTREAKLLGAGLSPERAWKSACNGHGPWWNAGASHMHAALPNRYFDEHGLVSLLSRHRRWPVAS
jgi:RNA-directed DNA polymerase